MKYTEGHCGRCRGDTKQMIMGIFPMKMLVQPAGDEWAFFNYCLGCDGFVKQEVTEEMLEQAEERYVNILVDEDFISEEEAKSILG